MYQPKYTTSEIYQTYDKLSTLLVAKYWIKYVLDNFGLQH